ncbi:MAG: S9 family peptidase [Acidimicrobiales bacterium]
MKNVAAYGTWASPIDAELLVAGAVGLSSVSCAGGRVWWVESRPSDAGRAVVVSCTPDASEPPRDETPEGVSARTLVHEYGGRCHVVWDPSGWDPLVVYSNFDDQRLWALHGPSRRSRPLTPAVEGRSVRYADPVVSADGSVVICVREAHSASGVANDLVAVPLWAEEGWLSEGSEPVTLADGHDFFSAPRVSPDGGRLAWITWDHPDMPWDSTCLWVAEMAVAGGTMKLGPATLVAGGPGESVSQPRWSPGGVLHYLSDRSGWWNVYDEVSRPLTALEAEVGEPDWVFGNSQYTFDSSGRLVATWTTPQGRAIGWEDQPGGGLVEIDGLPYSSFSSLQTCGDAVVCVAGSPTLPACVVRIDRDGSHRVLARSRQTPLPEAFASTPTLVDFPTPGPGGPDVAHALFYPPASGNFEGPPGDLPPLVVVIHGGPTSQAQRLLNLTVQYWTTRGFAVADVDYRGSSGYGRAYREKLKGAWGVADVADVGAVVAELRRLGLVDPAKAFIRGGSAGGLTTLAALASSDAFAAGASLYGVADLEMLARDTHKFEAHYLDSLVGPWPQARAEYVRRSPLHNAASIRSPLVMFQGLDDMVVPPSQSQAIFDALDSAGVRVEYHRFEGEGHGFRKAETIVAVYQAELAFYLEALGQSKAR